MPEVGVIGGLGPAATVDFMARVLASTQARTDQEHANLVVLQHSSVPDRTAFITGASAQDPTADLVADAQRLEALGVTAIVMPCNTATAFVEAMRAAVQVPIVDIVDVAVEDAADRGWKRIAVLATDGTRAARTYDRAAQAHGLEVAYPEPEEQATLNTLIYDHIKAGVPAPEGLLESVVDAVLAQGADGVVLGCTELSVAGAGLVHPQVLDALDSLARRTVVAAGATVKG